MSGIIEAGSELDSESGVQGELQGVRNDPIEQSESESPNFNGLTSRKVLVIVLVEIKVLLEDMRAIPQPHPSMKRVSTDKNGKRKCWSSGIKYSTP